MKYRVPLKLTFDGFAIVEAIDEETVDIDYKDITATIVYREDKPELIPEVELVIDGYIMDITIKE